MASAEEKSAQNEGVEDLSAAAELKDQQRPTLKATRKATRGKRTQDPPESESPDPNEADLPTENAAAVEGKVKVAVAKPAAEDGVANCEEVEDDDYEDEPSRLLEAALAVMASLWGYLKAGVTRLAGACRAAGSRLAGLVGLLTYLAVLYGAGYYLAEPYSKKEIPDLASKLLVGLHAGVWLFMPLILGMVLRGQLRPAGGQLFPLLCLMTLNLCVLPASLPPEEIHWVLVTARTLAVFEMVKLVSELVKLPYLVRILGHPLQFSVPLLFLYNLYHLVMMDLGFHQPEEPDVGTEQGTSSGWSMCGVVENLCGSPAIG